MSTDDIKVKAKDFILKEFLPGEPADCLEETTELMTGGILDSLATLKLVSFLEETYSISIDPHELAAENLNSIAQIASFVQSKQA